MKIALEVFDEILVLSAEQAVAPREVLVLNAGISKLAGRGARWLFVDLTGAALEPESVRQALATGAGREPPAGSGVKKVYYVGAVPGLCEFESMDLALQACPAAEARLLRDRARLDKELRSLSARDQEQEAERAEREAGRPPPHALRARNQQLKRLKASMEKEIESFQKGAALDKSRPLDSKVATELTSLREEIRQALKEAGIP